MLQRLLEGGGHSVFPCSGQSDALDVAGRHELDLAVVCETPGHRDIAGLVRRLRQVKSRLTVMRITDAIAENGSDCGTADDYLLRPVDLDAIEAKVRELLKASSTGKLIA